MKLPASLKAHLGPASLVALALIILVISIWLLPSLPGADTWGHLFKAEFLAGQMHQSGIGAYFTTAWMPAWYLGDPFRTYYPPLTTLVLAPLVYLTGNPVTAFALFASGALLAMAVLTYGFIHHLWGPWPAAFGTILALWAPYQVRTLLFEGNLPRVLALLGLPAIAWLTDALLTSTNRRITLTALLGLAWCWTILAHPQQAVMFAVGLLIFLLARFLLDTGLPIRAGGYWLAGLVLGAALSAAWLLPAYSHAELSDVPFLPVEKVSLFSTPLSAILPASSLAAGRIVIGTGTLVIALLAAVARPDSKRTSWFVAGLATIWLALGPAGVLFNLLPLHDQLLPERFLNFSAFALPVAAAGILPIRRKAQVVRIAAVAAIALIDLYPSASLLTPRAAPTDAAALASLGDRDAGYGGRTALMTYPEPTGPEVYYAGRATDVVNGWALENTPHNVALRRFLSAPEWSDSYFEHLLSIWDVRQVLVRGDQADAQATREALLMDGWSLVNMLGQDEVWRPQSPVGPVQAIPASRMLVVGDGLPPLLGTFPFAEESSLRHLSQIATTDLDAYPAVALFQFESSENGLAAADAKLTDYVSAGGRVITDLSGMEALIGRSSSLLGVKVMRLAFHDHINLRWKDPAAGAPTVLPLERVAPDGWSGAVYDGLDGVVAEAEYNDQWYPILGYKEIGKGRAWFVGLNLLYYSQQASLPEISRDIAGRALDGVDISRAVTFDELPTSSWRATGQSLSFSVVAPPAGAEALVSYTYSPRWRVLLDGSPVSSGQYEGLLRISLPGGMHQVEVDYRPYGTPWPALGLILTVLGVIAVTAAVVWERAFQLPIPVVPRKAEGALPSTKSYVPCANCGFRLSEAGPPTAITYPFQVVHCPICGLSMDDEGFQAGATLTPEERARRLDDWLAQYSYDPGIVHGKWGFEVDAFFAESPKEDESPSDRPLGGGDAEPHTDR